MVWAMITDFVQSYKNQISGKFDAKKRQIEPGAHGPQQ